MPDAYHQQVVHQLDQTRAELVGVRRQLADEHRTSADRATELYRVRQLLRAAEDELAVHRQRAAGRPVETRHLVEIHRDGVRVHGEGELTGAGREALAELLGQAREQLAADIPQLFLVRTDPVQEIAAETATLAAFKAELFRITSGDPGPLAGWAGTVGPLFGLQLVVDDTLRAGCVAFRPYRGEANLNEPVPDPSWSVLCPEPRCRAAVGDPCVRWNGSPSTVSCGKRWTAYDAARGRSATSP